ncbi:Mu-like prophage major head subunit gpT family protein, partial [Achromobacter dolens]
MIINHANLAILNTAYNAAFQSGLTIAAPMWNQLAMMVPSTTSAEKYAWLGS